MLGNTESVLEIVSACDILLLPSDSESFGLAALEARACGVPVIGTAAGGLPEVVEDGISGFLRPVGDVKGMASAARKLINNKTLHKEMAASAKETAMTKFSIGALLDRYEEVYRQALVNR
jgi:glycosyltransferase involved in cell wall biosynthesis